MLIDTHCHLTYDDLAAQLDAVIDRAEQAGVRRLITIATDASDARRAIGVLERHPRVLLAAGVHPHQADCDESVLCEIEELHRGRWGGDAPGGRLVAVGETGLDFHYDFVPRPRQEQVFRRQIELALQVGRPIVIHARRSEERVCDVLSEYSGLADRVVFHCFSGGVELARRVLDLGFWLSFTGVVTFRNADEIRQAAKFAPADRVMVETDAPYLTPEPHRKVRPNEPAFVSHTARRLAEIRGESYDRLAERTTANAVRFFGLAGDQA